MKKAKFSDNDVCAVTGHKDPLSLRNYSHLDGAACREFAKVIDHTTAELARRHAEKENQAEAPTSRESPASTAKKLKNNNSQVWVQLHIHWRNSSKSDD